jgi:alanine dehydrogenase
VISSTQSIWPLVRDADLVIGAVLLPGKLAPKLITADDVKCMRAGSVIVDVAIDQGRIYETSRSTSHSNPFYVEHGVVHCCVPNMPSAVARTATQALTYATFPMHWRSPTRACVRRPWMTPDCARACRCMRVRLRTRVSRETPLAPLSIR